jgi:hypothetical protein
MRDLIALAVYLGIGFGALGLLAWLDMRRNR